MIRYAIAALILAGCASKRPAPKATEPTTRRSAVVCDHFPATHVQSCGTERLRELEKDSSGRWRLVQAASVAAPKPKPEKQPVQNLFFEVNEDTLRPQQLGALTRLRKWQARNPVPLRCTGYADTLGSDSANYALALRRAQAVARHVACRIEVVGETQEFGPDAANRRVKIIPDKE